MLEILLSILFVLLVIAFASFFIFANIHKEEIWSVVRFKDEKK